MNRRYPAAKPSFFWQGLLILLPVLVLAAVGALSLRQDRVLAQHEAADRAQEVADDLVPRLWAELSRQARPFAGQTFAVNSAGQLVFPPPYAPAPEPRRFDPEILNAEQARLWSAAAQAEGSQPAAAARAYDQFLRSNPPEDFAAAARYSLGLLWIKLRDLPAAAEQFATLLEKHPAAFGESGLPLQPLAQLKLLELHVSGDVPVPARSAVTFEAFCSNLVTHPTPLTSRLLDAAQGLARTPQARTEVDQWRRRWEACESSRQLFAAVRRYFRTGRGGGWPEFPLKTAPTGAGNASAELPELALFRAADRFLAADRPPVPLSPRLFWFSTPYTVRAIITNPAAFFQLRSPPELPDDSAKITYTDSAGHAAAVELDSRDWLALRFEDNVISNWFVCYPETEVAARLRALVNSARIPEYFGVGVEVAGRRLEEFDRDLRLWRHVHHGGKGGHVDKEFLTDLATNVIPAAASPGSWVHPLIATNILASAAQSEAGMNQLKVNVFLTSPSAVLERQRTRTFWFGSLIGVSAAAAVLGFLAARSAFRRQQQLNDLKGNFVSSVSHELRAPIASVRLMAESLERGRISEPPRQQEYFRFIVQECRRLSALVENVLDFSRIEQGRKEYEFGPTDVAALVQQTVKLMEPYAAERGVALALTAPDPRLSSLDLQPSLDGKAIQQALVNLVDNAIKHSPKGGTVELGLEARNEPEPAATGNPVSRFTLHDSPSSSDTPPGVPHPSHLLLWVQDHGEGIPPEEHEKIFQRFYRRGSELRRETQGVGIGLSIVKHIVEAHRGRVLVRSAVGQGSRFTLDLPCAIEGQRPTPKSA